MFSLLVCVDIFPEFRSSLPLISLGSSECIPFCLTFDEIVVYMRYGPEWVECSHFCILTHDVLFQILHTHCGENDGAHIVRIFHAILSPGLFFSLFGLLLRLFASHIHYKLQSIEIIENANEMLPELCTVKMEMVNVVSFERRILEFAMNQTNLPFWLCGSRELTINCCKITTSFFAGCHTVSSEEKETRRLG